MNSYENELRLRSKPLVYFSDVKPLIDSIKDKKVVMLGESSHGTSEFYQWRKEISLELITRHGFNFIAVEGDWPPCYQVNHFLNNPQGKSSHQVLKAFDRWPTWMWANTDVAELINELMKWNKNREEKAGFYGLDVYSLVDSIDETIRSLKEIDPHLAQKASRTYSCFDPYRKDEKEYARSLFRFPEGCREEVVKTLQELLSLKLQRRMDSDLFNAIQNARIVKNAESYYRAMVSFDDDSWNVRDRHMMETLDTLFEYYGQDAKAIVWEHNTHIGDYRATDMVLHGQINIGGLAREKYGQENVSLVGFGTYTGTVIASHAWDGPALTLPVPEAKIESLEDHCHNLSQKMGSDFFLLFDDAPSESVLNRSIGHRAIGVVYHPEYERRGNYVPTILPKRYDAFVFIDKTHALVPFQVGFDPRKFPESYPHGTRL